MNKRNKAEGELPSIWHFHSGKYLLFSFGLIWENVPCTPNYKPGLKSLWLLPFQAGQAASPDPGMYLQSHGWAPAGRVLLAQASIPLLSGPCTVAGSCVHPQGCPVKRDLDFYCSNENKWRINHRSNPGETGRKVTSEQSPGCPPMPKITPAA